MLSKFKKKNHQEYLDNLTKLSQFPKEIITLYDAKSFRKILLDKIINSQNYIYITTLYLENDDAGKEILNALYQSKIACPQLDIKIMVDWHRAQRTRIGTKNNITNANWYYQNSLISPEINIPIFGIPINTREALGVLHLKGFILDDIVIYTGASINNVYLHQHQYYRYDRYHIFKNIQLATTMKTFIDKNLLSSPAIQRLDQPNLPKNANIKSLVKKLRHNLKSAHYQFQNSATNKELGITPLIGLGKKNKLNKTITNLMYSTQKNIIICTPYFNLPTILTRIIIKLLKNEKEIEIIVGDKTANDFYFPPDKPFKIIGALPYLYEINLRKFIYRLQYFINKKKLIIRLWKNGTNSYHLKGIWVDDNWQLLTGNNLNPRAWGLDLENAILIHDPKKTLTKQKNKELKCIRLHTNIIQHYEDIENIQNYPKKIKTLLLHLRRVHIDKLIRHIV
ncbi:CDP-diacylglycerol--serine O-phosphatidyltransferase [Arsenophonus symbiont of Ornithomya chloropus]|uniref:CDP-diacylglycerol--serine O-phosphatidyltransferase n=1 Tax=Arsenophonus symbiont of Ornithomya chloropus TaxID=634121 RepID=UPI0032B14E16